MSEEQKMTARIRLVRETIMELRKTHSPNSLASCWGCVGVLDFLESGEPQEIMIPELREKIQKKLGRIRG